MRKKCFSDREKLLQSETEGQEFAKFLRSNSDRSKQFLKQFSPIPGGFSDLISIRTITYNSNWKWDLETYRKD